MISSYSITPDISGECSLEPNHTHFLLFDDGQITSKAILDLRARIEQYLTTYKFRSEANHMITAIPIPIVTIMFNGGYNSIETFCKSLIMKTPIVVFKVRNVI